METKKLGTNPTNLQRAKLLEKGNALRRRIEAWWTVQQLYMPGVVGLRSREDLDDGGSAATPVYELELLMPSAVVGRVPTYGQLQETEWRLRHAHAYEGLENLRRHLLLRSSLYKFKDRFVSGQRHQTRSITVINNLQAKIDADAVRYRVAHVALTALSVPLQKVGWQNFLRPLRDEDVRGLSDRDLGESAGRVVTSWVWVSTSSDDGNREMQEGMYICRRLRLFGSQMLYMD